MTDEQKKLIKKLNQDNEKLNQMHNTMIEYSKYKFIVGILVVFILIILYYVQSRG